MSALVVVLGLWALGVVGAAWVVVLSRMLTTRRESDEGRTWHRRWVPRDWGDTVPENVPFYLSIGWRMPRLRS